jgi:YceI-like domain
VTARCTPGAWNLTVPTAAYKLTEPVELPAGLREGERATASATGELTIHGVTNLATVELQAELQGGAAVVVGSAPVALAGYGIEPPTGFTVLSISDDGTFEFQFFISKARSAHDHSRVVRNQRSPTSPRMPR